jgi:hypothetical protein
MVCKISLRGVSSFEILEVGHSKPRPCIMVVVTVEYIVVGTTRVLVSIDLSCSQTIKVLALLRCKRF